jgi:1,4-dihydroxy-2-naphthoate octaprenyltransferase
MKKHLIDAIAPFYLGGALSLFGHVHWFQWQFWAILVPFFLLVKITKFNQD